MKLKKSYLYILSLFSILVATACSSDIEKIYVLPQDDIELTGNLEDIILNAETPDALVLSIFWNGDGKLSLTDENYETADNAAEETIQMSKNEDFSASLELATDKGVRYRQFKCEELNSLLGRLGYSSNSLEPLFIRISKSLGDNLVPQYSSVLKVNVQMYDISKKYAYVLDSDMNETGILLCSEQENGIYTGFLGVSGWYNWYLKEKDNVTWGNLAEEGKVFYASSESFWNFWYPAPAGCYYTTVNTIEGWWSALHIDTINIEGDITGEMTYNQKSNQWELSIGVESASNYNLTIKGTASLYDNTTTDVGEPIAKEVGFSGLSTNLQFGETSEIISLRLEAGRATLILDLSDPLNYILTSGEESEEEEKSSAYNDILYMSGFDDGISGAWTFDCWLTCYDSEYGKYAAVHQAHSLWGWLLYTDDNWGGMMGTDSEDPYSGNILEGGSNIPSPAPAKYLVDVSLSGMNYLLSEVTEVWFTGLNDDWSLTPMELVEGCIYQAEVEKYADTPWGVKILLRDDWSMWFGGSDGILRYGWDGFNGDNDLENGSYILTVDLAKCTYSYTVK